MATVVKKKKKKPAAAEPVKVAAKPAPTKPAPAKATAKSPAKPPEKKASKPAAAKPVAKAAPKKEEAKKATTTAVAASPATVSAAAAKKRQQWVDDMTPQARTVYLNEFEPHLLKSARTDVMSRFRLGKIAAKLLDDEDKYGKRTIECFANASGLDEKLLRAIISVYHWLETEERVEEILKQAEANKCTIGTTILGTLAVAINSPAQRNAWLDRVIKRRLSVRELTALLNKDRAGKEATAAPTTRPFTSPAAATRTLAKQAGNLSGLIDRWEKDAFASIVDDVDDDDLENLTQARAALQDTVDKAEAAIKEIDAAIEATKEEASAEAAKIETAKPAKKAKAAPVEEAVEEDEDVDVETEGEEADEDVEEEDADSESDEEDDDPDLAGSLGEDEEEEEEEEDYDE